MSSDARAMEDAAAAPLSNPPPGAWGHSPQGLGETSPAGREKGRGQWGERRSHRAQKGPYLSFVLPSRNDDHGGNMLARLQACVDGLLEQVERHRLDSELILVDWNPPEDRPLLRDAIRWPKRLSFCTVRTLVVPPAIHRRYREWDKVGFHNVVSRNAGIRRARGRFVLPVNQDLLYSEELMSYLASRVLEDECIYRIDRFTVDRRVVRCATHAERLAFCRKNIIYHDAHLHWGAEAGLPDLHTNACGDFQLLARSHWHRLRGLPEMDVGYSLHCDGIFLYMAYAGGVRERLLGEPLRLYHIDHEQVWARPWWRIARYLRLPFMSHRAREDISRRISNHIYPPTALDRLGVSRLSDVEYLEIMRDVLSGRSSFVLNGPDWGLGGEALTERTLLAADWDENPPGG